MMAVWCRGKADPLLHHSDQGSQYSSEQFRRLLADNGSICSMSRAGDVRDKSAMEGFFSSPKTELTNRKVHRTRDEPRADVFDDIERFCNPRSRHAKPGYLNPHGVRGPSHAGFTRRPPNRQKARARQAARRTVVIHVRAASKTRRRLNGTSRLPSVIEGVKLTDTVALHDATKSLTPDRPASSGQSHDSLVSDGGHPGLRTDLPSTLPAPFAFTNPSLEAP